MRVKNMVVDLLQILENQPHQSAMKNLSKCQINV